MRPKSTPVRAAHRARTRSRPLLCVVLSCAGTLLLPPTVLLHADDTWTGASSPNWSDAGNWTNGVPSGSNYGTLIFATQTNSPSNDDITGLSENKLSNTTGAFTINGIGDISLFDNGGTQAKIENNGTGLFTLNLATLNFSATTGAAWGEINAVTGDITFGTANTLNVNGSQVAGIRLFGNAGRTTTFNNTVNASGKYFDTASTSAQIVTIGGSFTSGDFFLMNGSTLNNGSAGSGFAAANLRLGGDFATSGNQNLASGATFNLTVLAGGQTFAGGVNSVAGNTSNALIINSQNTSNTNTLSGGFFLDSNLRVNQSGAAGTLLLGAAGSTNTISFQNAGSRTLTLNASGSTTSAITVNEAFTNVLDGSDVLITLGNGTTATTTINANNSASGANLLLFNVQSGSLAISAANNLGSPVVSGGGYPDKVLFGAATGSTTGTLQINGTFAYGSATAGSLLGFAVNRSSGTNVGRINVSGTNVFTMNGALSDFGTAANAGNFEFNNGTGATSTGTITLNAASSYAGTSTLAGGLLNLGNAGALSTGAFIFGGAASFDNTSGAAMTISNAMTLSGGSPTFVGTNNLTINGAVTISGGTTRTITVTANTLTLNGNIGQDASARTLAKAGAGTLTLNGASNFTGGLTLTAGTLNLNNAAAVGTGTFTINGGTLDTTAGAALTSSTNPAITFGGSFAFGGSNSLNLGTGTVSVNNDRTITLNGNNTNTLTFGGPLTNTTASAKTLNVNNATGVSGESVIFNGFTLATASTANVIYALNATGNLVFNGPITNGTGTGANGFSFTGGTAGTLTLSGANTYTGVTTFNSGTLNVNSAGALGSGIFTIGGGTLNNTSGAAITGQTNNPAIVLNNSFAFGGSNSLNLGTGAVTISSDRTITLNGNNTNTLTFGGVMSNNRLNTGVNIAVNNATGVSGETLIFTDFNLATNSTAAVTDIISGNGNVTFNGTLANGNANANPLNITNTGIVTFAGTSTYTGATTIQGAAGTVRLTGTLGSGGGTAITVSNAATLNESTTGVIAGASSLTVNNAGTAATLAGTNTYTGTTTLNSGTLNVNSAGALGSGIFTIGGGTLNNTSGAAITGQTNNPAIVLNNSFAFGGSSDLNLGNGTVSVGADRTITVNGSNRTLTFGGTLQNTQTASGFNLTVNNGTGVTGGTVVFNNGFNLQAANGTVAVTNIISGTGNTVINGVVANGGSGNNALTKNDAGTLTLNGANTYTGVTTVNGGTLLVNGNQTAATGTTVASGTSTLGGTGTIGGTTTINGPATITGATSGTIGALTLNNTLTLAGTSGSLATYLVDIGGANADRLTITGSLSLSTNFDQITFSQLSDLTAASYTLLSYTGTRAGTFDVVTNLPSGYSLSYATPGEIDLVASAVPEPATWAAGSLLVGLTVFRLRRRLAGAKS